MDAACIRPYRASRSGALPRRPLDHHSDMFQLFMYARRRHARRLLWSRIARLEVEKQDEPTAKINDGSTKPNKEGRSHPRRHLSQLPSIP